MFAVLILNNMVNKRRIARKESLLKRQNEEIKQPEVSLCRTCLSTDDLELIFVSKNAEKKRSEDLMLATGLEIKMDDGLSQKICKKCIKMLKCALKFRRTSKKAEKSLLKMISEKATKKIPKLDKKVSKTIVVKEYYDVPLDESNDFQNDDNMGSDFQDNGFQNDVYTNENENNAVKQEEIEPKVKRKPSMTPRKKSQVVPNAPQYKCNTCNKEFQMKATYKAHMRFHTNYCVCESCGKRCRNNNQLQEHKRAKHGLGRIHKCAYCEYSAATKEALIIHERRHTGERPYVCDHCGATFHRRSNLVQHIAVHLPEKNFQCDMCPKRLKSRKFLQIHKHNAHTGKRYGYLCAVCEHRFEKPNKVRAHTRRVHGIPDEQQGPIVRVTR